MNATFLYGYLTGWVLTTIGLALTVHQLQDPARALPHPIPLSIAAGAAWPVLILGAVEMAAVAVAVEVIRRRGAGAGGRPPSADAVPEKVSDSRLPLAPNCERSRQGS